jgi:hypothetical protein
MRSKNACYAAVLNNASKCTQNGAANNNTTNKLIKDYFVSNLKKN